MMVLRLLGIRGVLLVLAIAVVIGLAVRIDWLTADRDLAQADLSAATRDLALARADAHQAEMRLRTVTAALELERTRAVASERLASRLREQIARDTGTERDAATAPVLRDAIRGLSQGIVFPGGQSLTPLRDHALEGILEDVFVAPLSRQVVSWTITVVVAGRIELVTPVMDGPACRSAAAAVVAEITARAEFEARLKGRVLIVCAAGRRIDA